MEENNFYELDIIQFLKELLRKWWAIALSTILCACAAFSYAEFLITPMYEAETLLYVNNSSFSVGNTSFTISQAELSAAQSLVDTYIVILKTRTTLNTVIKDAELDYSYEELKGMISSVPVNSTEVFSVKVKSSNPKEAEKIANSIARVLPDKISEVVEGSSVRIVDYAVVPGKKVSPSITKYTLIGAVLGIVIACAIIFIKVMADTRIHDDDYLINKYKLPILASIPNISQSSKKKGYGYYGSYENKGE